MSCACQCSCRLPENQVLKKDSCIQTSPMFEFVGSIPHIDSDEDDEKESIKSGKITFSHYQNNHYELIKHTFEFGCLFWRDQPQIHLASI